VLGNKLGNNSGREPSVSVMSYCAIGAATLSRRSSPPTDCRAISALLRLSSWLTSGLLTLGLLTSGGD
jgi:hypothetical protein